MSPLFFMKKIILLVLTFFSLSSFSNDVDYEPYVCGQNIKMKAVFEGTFLKTVKRYYAKGMGYSFQEAEAYMKIEKKFQLAKCERELKEMGIVGFCYTARKQCSAISYAVDFPF